MSTMLATDARTLNRLSDLVETLRGSDGFDAVVAALRAGHSGAVDGAWGSSAGLTVAALGADAPATVLVVLAHPGDLEAWGDELAGFANVRPTVFPIDENGTGGHMDLASGQRLRVLQQLRGDAPPRFLLAPMASLIQPVP